MDKIVRVFGYLMLLTMITLLLLAVIEEKRSGSLDDLSAEEIKRRIGAG